MSLPSLAAAIALAASSPACPPVVADGHHVRATGASHFVKAKKGGHREIVVRGVDPAAVRQHVEDETGCEFELAAFVDAFRAAPHELHARVGRHAIRVREISYDPATMTLRTKGRLERDPKAKRRASARQAANATMVVYASTFIPFDSSF